MDGAIVLIGFIINLVFAAICGSVAESKNRNGALWGVLGFFGGLLILVIILILEDAYVETSTYGSSKPMYPEPRKTPEKKPVEIKPTIKSYNNFQYVQSEPIRCPKLIVSEYPYKTTTSIKLRHYDQILKVVKADLKVVDLFEEVHVIESVIFDMEKPDDKQWQTSKEVVLQTDTKLHIEHIVSAEVIVKSVVFEDDSKCHYDLASYVVADETEPLGHLRVLYGDDVFAKYQKTGLGYICVCGKNNAHGEEDCEFCGRSVVSMSQEIDDLALISSLQACETLEDGLDVYECYKHTLPEALSEKLKKKIDADLYVKRVYGMPDQKVKIKQWVSIIQE